jgi:hypothetical protein
LAVAGWDQNFFFFWNKILLCSVELDKCHSMLCLFVWGSYWKHQVSSTIIHRLNKLFTTFLQAVLHKSTDLLFSKILH